MGGETSDVRKRREEVRAAFNEKRAFSDREDEADDDGWHDIGGCEGCSPPWREDFPEPDWHKGNDNPYVDDSYAVPDDVPQEWDEPLADWERELLEAHDPVTKPAHYTHSRIEVWDAIDAWGLNYFLGNVVKYVARADRKGNAVEDLEKAQAYIAKELERRREWDAGIVNVLDEHGFKVGEKRLPDRVEFR